MFAADRPRPAGLGFRAVVATSCAVAVSAALLVAQDTGTLTVSVKGSSAYAQPTPVPVKTALLVVTPHWEDINAVTPTGGREASGQPLFLSDLVVAFSNLELDCAAVFKAKLTAPTDFLIAAGKAEAYIPSNGWQSTAMGKLMTDNAGARTINVDRFSVDAQYMVSKKKMSSKDGLHGADGHLVLTEKDGAWTADFAVKADELTAEGKIPVKSCGIVSRRKEELPPLLGERRLLTAGDRYGN
jgi:hypothetical protein